ncbi:von Willebrand factor A domain-containing protein 5A [Tritrichomonas musculus]|uniref:von Willebrand factor A domain-containing protein 5A n=1 Tax=Tritrichomonas musculus TaxID=1915356 RepID=A0ABR2IYP9_9EUKA
MSTGNDCPKNVFSLLVNDESHELIPEKIRYDGQMNNGVINMNILLSFKNDEEVADAILFIRKNSLQIIDNVEFKIDDRAVNIDSQIIENEKQNQIKLINENNLYENLKDFKLNLGRIPQRETCELSINMILLSKNAGSQTYKTFIPIPNQYLKKHSPDYFSFVIHYNEPIRISNVSVGSEKAQSRYNYEDKTFNIESIPQNPIILLTELENEIKNMVQCIMKNEYFLISVLPSYIEKLPKNDFIFVIDCSGSMDGEPIREVRECLMFYLHSLPPNCKFNLIFFGDTYKCLFNNKLVDYNDENLQIAKDAAKKIKGDLDGTELYNPLVEAYRQSKESHQNGRFTQIFILTDGIIEDENKVFKLVEENRLNCAVNTIGVGDDVSKKLIEGIAKHSNGKFDFVTNSTDISQKVLETVSNALNLEMKNITVRILDDNNDILLEWKLNAESIIRDRDLIHFIIKRQNNKQNSINQVKITGFVNEKEVSSIIDDIHKYFSEEVSKSIIPKEIADPQTLIDIISSQESNGKWKGDHINVLTNFLKNKINNDNFSEKIDNINKAVEILTLIAHINDNDEINDIKSTIIAICILNTLYMEEKSKWKLVEEKAYGWLKQKSQNIWKNEILLMVNSFSNPTQSFPLSFGKELREKIASINDSPLSSIYVTNQNQTNENDRQKVLGTIGKYKFIMVKTE